MAIAARGTQPKAYTLDALRATAALLVVMLHIAPLAKPLGVDIPWNGVGTLGVHLFFVLSGYLICSAVLSRSYTPRRYALNRVFRILPAYFVALAVVLFLRDSSYLTSWGGLKDVLAHVFLIQIFFQDYRVSIHGVLWTLSIEWLFYGFMLVCAPLIRHRNRRWWFVAGMFAVALVYRIWMWRTYTTHGDLNFYAKQLPGMLDHFAAGVLMAMAMQLDGVRRFVQRRDVKTVGLVVSSVAVALAVALFHRYLPEKIVDGYWDRWFMVILFPLLFCGAAGVFMVFLMQFESRLAPFIRRSGLGLIGVCSYSLYLFHTMVIGSFAQAWRSNEQSRTIPSRLYLLFVVAGVFLVAFGSYFLVEKPFMQMRARFTGSRPASSLPPEDGLGKEVDDQMRLDDLVDTPVSDTAALASRPSQ